MQIPAHRQELDNAGVALFEIVEDATADHMPRFILCENDMVTVFGGIYCILEILEEMVEALPLVVIWECRHVNVGIELPEIRNGIRVCGGHLHIFHLPARREELVIGGKDIGGGTFRLHFYFLLNGVSERRPRCHYILVFTDALHCDLVVHRTNKAIFSFGIFGICVNTLKVFETLINQSLNQKFICTLIGEVGMLEKRHALFRFKGIFLLVQFKQDPNVSSTVILLRLIIETGCKIIDLDTERKVVPLHFIVKIRVIRIDIGAQSRIERFFIIK